MKTKLKFLGKKSYCWLVFAFIIASFVAAGSVRAATFFMTPQNIDVQKGDTFTVDLKVNSTDQGFNAAQATLQFPKDIISIKSVNFSPTASIFNFWLDGPRYSNTDGTMSFIGGTTNGVVGASIQVLSVTFLASNTGTGTIALSDAAITASDGSGTNILTTVGSANVTVNAGTGSSNTGNTGGTSTSTTPANQSTSTVPTNPAVLPPTIEKIPPPVQIIRTPTTAKVIPKSTDLKVPFYPDPNKWYNLTSNYLATWNLTSDISGVSTIVNNNIKFTPPKISEGLFNSKFFPALADGVWYLHLMLENNKGWGDVSSYRIAIDTVPPLSFTIDTLDGGVTDNPTPTLHFETKDALSGLNYYLVRVGQEADIKVSTTTLKLPVQTPGKKNILVEAVDMAGNIRESTLSLEILPIVGPTINSLNKDVYIDQGNLLVSGTALPGLTVMLALKNTAGTTFNKTEVIADKNGNWETKFNGPFQKGSYYIEAITRDGRGATSLPVKSDTVKITQKPFLIIGALKVTLAWFLAIIVLILIILLGGAYLYFRRWRQQLVRKSLLAQRDILNLFNSVQKDLANVVTNAADNGLDAHKNAEISYLLKNSEKKLAKAEKYILDNIKEIAE